MKRLLMMVLSAGLACAQADRTASEHRSYANVTELAIDDVTGFIHVTGAPVSTVELDITRTVHADSPDYAALADKEVKLTTTQEGGLVKLLVDGPFRCHCGDHDSINFHGDEGYHVTYDFTVRVPRDVKLNLSTVNRSDIRVENTSGDFRLRNVNGAIVMQEISGSGSATTVNGGVTAVFSSNPRAATSFKSVNGKLDVSFRPNLNADVRMKTFNGGMFTDFQVGALPVAATAPERVDGKYVYRRNRMTGVRIGAGGPELSFETLNGDVLIRNREK